MHVESLQSSDNLRLSAALLGIDGKERPSSPELIDAEGARHVVWVAGVLSLLDLSRAYRSNTNAQLWRDARLLIGDAFLAQRKGDHHNHKSKLKEALALLEEIQGPKSSPRTGPNPPLNTDAPPDGGAPVS